MSSSNRGERIEHLLKTLKKHYKPIQLPEGRSTLEQLVYAACLEDARFEVADEIFAKIQQNYHDWNEIRVTTIAELSEMMQAHPYPSQAATRLKKSLQAIFESRYSYDIEDLAKLAMSKAVEVIEAWPGTSRFISSFLQQNAFGGHCIPVGNATLHALCAAGVLTSVEAEKGTAPGIDRAVPKQKGPEFFSLLHQFAADYQVDPKNSAARLIVVEMNPEGTKRRDEAAAAKAKAPPKSTEKSPAKPAGKPSPTKEPEKASTKETVKESAKEKAKEPAKAAEKAPAEKVPVKNPLKAHVKEALKGGIKPPGKDDSKDSHKEKGSAAKGGKSHKPAEPTKESKPTPKTAGKGSDAKAHDPKHADKKAGDKKPAAADTSKKINSPKKTVTKGLTKKKPK